MRNKRNVFIAGITLLGALQLGGYARADDTALIAASSPPQSQNPFAEQPLLDDQTLDARRGGTEVVNDMKLNGVVSDNQAYNLVTGSNSITEGAFAGASGLPTVIQNSGNNVLIQNATIVNVQLQ
jgi:hypothetical protein